MRNVMKNLRVSGECAYCGEDSDRLFEPPLLSPPSWRDLDKYDEQPGWYWWHVPGQAYPGKNLYRKLTICGENYLRGDDTPDEPMCWLCWSGHVCPAERQYVINKPDEFDFNGWCDPV